MEPALFVKFDEIVSPGDEKGQIRVISYCSP